jgi:hypothetical protein
MRRKEKIRDRRKLNGGGTWGETLPPPRHVVKETFLHEIGAWRFRGLRLGLRVRLTREERTWEAISKGARRWTAYRDVFCALAAYMWDSKHLLNTKAGALDLSFWVETSMLLKVRKRASPVLPAKTLPTPLLLGL